MNTVSDRRPMAGSHTAPPGHLLLRYREWSVLVLYRGLLATLGLTMAMFFVAGLALALGTADLNPLTALAAAFGTGTEQDVFIVRELRLPRVVTGILVGMALGTGGCLMQTLARNRLATPGIVGIDNGATAFAVASVVALTTGLAPSGMSLAGSITALVLVLALSGGTGTRGYRFLVVGIGVGAVFGSITNYLLARAPIDSANAAYPWTVGSLNARAGGSVALLAIGLAITLPVAVFLGRQLSTMRLSDQVAQSLGISVRRVRVGTLMVAVTLSALSVAVAGPVGMIALLAPEAARYLAGPRTVPVLGSAVAGALFTVLADLAGRTLFAPIEIPVGVITAVVGGPYLLWVLLRSSSRRII